MIKEGGLWENDVRIIHTFSVIVQYSFWYVRLKVRNQNVLNTDDDDLITNEFSYMKKTYGAYSQRNAK